ncbi:succinoglycan biosynthesis protein exoa [Devosia geojensis]|uniref:Succinoglycan biosynthesis protein exoa n=1 Tax=Devosia geojensis TaxID=443610 RepID=A0A0F5FWH7_9HYPH|nr:glycosyltransferase family 2 protein [Devosia geojensis]KKB12935.1 succinoglycan biosynthesis protein exoa [Devosia geojensis]
MSETSAPVETYSRCLIVVPTLNEARHIAGLLDMLMVEAEAMGASIVVADGGSTDGTRDIAARYAQQHASVSFIDNPKRIQSAAINLAVEKFGDEAEYVVRIDAHGKYPPDYCRALVREAQELGVDSIVVPMITVGESTFQRAVATAQNSLVGTGGSAHRTGLGGRFVDHGHHALMRISAYRAVGGYDETFRFNEDAELDYRLNSAGYRIWLTAATVMTYYPRSTPSKLFKQYFGYGSGRARNILKHRMVPRVRQMLPLVILPAVALALLSFVHWSALVPLVLWCIACLALGAYATYRHFDKYGLPFSRAPLVGVAAMIMHLAWSSGFWLHVARTFTGDGKART